MNAKEEKSLVVLNQHINKNYFLMKLKADYIAANCKPGNFIMLSASRTSAPLLKRPFGILKAEPPYIWLYYEIVGKGTDLIASLAPNDPVDLIGPLGNSFPPMDGKNILMVAGGRGIAPIFYAIKDFSVNNSVYLIYGARSKDDMNLLEYIEELGLKDIFLYTDDGSFGKKGFVTSDIKQIIGDKQIDATFSCGPDAMFENLYHTIGNNDTDNYVSLEAMMGCGFGICYSCAVKTAADTYKKVCSDGPVFKMEEIAW
jgi:dihydroorotate dehydrogenase electron transfer subunit